VRLVYLQTQQANACQVRLSIPAKGIAERLPANTCCARAAPGAT
jgi:hypothetical protein